MKAEIFDPRVCALGEGLLWHPERRQIFWFDILGKQLLSQRDGTPLSWTFDEHVSAAGWIDHDTLLIASETALFQFDLNTGTRTNLHALEADTKITRSNDGRADPWGGFWIGTMGKNAEASAGAIYRLYGGELRKIIPDITISNAICFAPDSPHAYYTDTVLQEIMRVPLDPQTGWPNGPESSFIDLMEDGINPDGAVTDAAGQLWVAQWGLGRVTCYGPNGTAQSQIQVGGKQSSCPAFGGPDLRDLYVTTAAIGLSRDQKELYPDSGKTFIVQGVTQGRPEPRVVL